MTSFTLMRIKNHAWVQHKGRYLLCEPSVKFPNIMHVKPAYLLPHYSMKKLFSYFKYLSSSCQAPEWNLNVSSDKHTSTNSSVIIGIPEKQQKYYTHCFLTNASFPNWPLIFTFSAIWLILPCSTNRRHHNKQSWWLISNYAPK